MSREKSLIKKKTGKITSDKMDKTVVVEIERFKNHPLYNKKYRISNKIKAHDPENQYKINDIVEIEETVPISKSKCWKVNKLISKAAK